MKMLRAKNVDTVHTHTHTHTSNLKNKGITLIVLVITIIILLILAGITILAITSDNGLLNKVKQSKQAQIEAEMKESLILAIDELQLEKSGKATINDITQEWADNKLGEYNPEVKNVEIQEKIIELTKNGITKRYKINEDLSIEEIELSGITLEYETGKREGDKINICIKITAKDGIKEIHTPEPDVLKCNGQEEVGIDYKVKFKEEYIFTIITKTGQEKQEKILITEIDESEMFSKAIGVIDIVWLNTDNTIRQTPLSPKGNLAGLTPVKYSESENKWIEADENNSNNDWYNYEEQEGNIDGKTSNWANAVANYNGQETEKAYFVWIPRYAYKITYFDTQENANAYRENNNSKTGIIGYSNIKGIVDVASGMELLVTGSAPTNVTGIVNSAEYGDYIPHPAFEFDGTKAGIWVGKFETSGSTSAVRIIPNKQSLRMVTVGEIFTACQGVKTTYNLTGDSHMMKNIEWGAFAYLAESKYGRNGTEIANNPTVYLTGREKLYNQY